MQAGHTAHRRSQCEGFVFKCMLNMATIQNMCSRRAGCQCLGGDWPKGFDFLQPIRRGKQISEGDFKIWRFPGETFSSRKHSSTRKLSPLTHFNGAFRSQPYSFVSQPLPIVVHRARISDTTPVTFRPRSMRGLGDGELLEQG